VVVQFYSAGVLIRESSKSTSKTVAKSAEDQRRRELEAGFHNLKEIPVHEVLVCQHEEGVWTRQ